MIDKENKEQDFIASTESSGIFSGVIEDDGESIFFYLHNSSLSEDNQILLAQRISSSVFSQKKKYSLVWSQDEKYISAVVDGQIAATFSIDRMSKSGGNIDKNTLQGG